MKRRIILLLLLLVGGAIINIAVVWGCALWSRTVETGAWFDRESRTSFRRFSGYGLDYVDFSVFPDNCAPFIAHFDLDSLIAGWPLKTMSCSRFGESAAVLPLGSRRLLRPANTFVPLLSIWPGFAINTVFYAALLWLMFAAPFALRRSIRRRRGLCPACAYPVGTSDVCTECGAAVTIKAARNASAMV